ncbi:MAG: cupredoxin family protein [Betaproteobacteria bacterium]
MATDSTLAVVAFALLSMLGGPAFAHGDEHGKPAMKSPPIFEETEFGQTGDPKKVTRTITVEMDDGFHYTPNRIVVKKGETVRIVAHNKGKLLHEIVIGSPDELREHAELMKKFPDMEHEAAHMAHVAPGKTGEIVWQFTRTGDFRFGCLVGGHFEAGMAGDISVR